MRVIAGKAKGRRLLTPRGRETRLTSDRVKGALFNILGQDLTGKSFLDLFAGGGGVGIEALSRGAEKVVFVEEKKDNVSVIKRNLALCGFREGFGVFPSSWEKAAGKLPKKFFDYIFLDPPYGVRDTGNILQRVWEHDIIASFTVIIAEHSRWEKLPDGFGFFLLSDRRKYGQTILSFYRNGKEANHEEKNRGLSGQF